MLEVLIDNIFAMFGARTNYVLLLDDSISFVDDTNHVPPDIPSRTDALLSIIIQL